MTANRHVVAVRCHRPDAATLRLYEAAIAAVGPANAFLCAGEFGAPPQQWPSEANVVRVTGSLLDELGLRHDLPDVAWRCGDYCYYALAKTVEFDQAWLIETDVMFSQLTLGDVVQTAAADASDFIAASFEPARDDWPHRASLADRGVDPVWHCLFSLTRASARAVGSALALRHATQWLASESPYPNDEAVFASAVANSGLRVRDLHDLLPGRLANFRYSPAKHFVGSLVQRTEGPQILHPALGYGDFQDYLRRRLSAARLRGPRFVVAEIIDRADDLCVQHVAVLREVLTPGERLILAASDVLGPALNALRSVRRRAELGGHRE